jgi:hypothetical protein
MSPCVVASSSTDGAHDLDIHLGEAVQCPLERTAARKADRNPLRFSARCLSAGYFSRTGKTWLLSNAN